MRAWLDRGPQMLVAVALASAALSPRLAWAQQPDQEILANLAAGKVTVWVARDGILIGTQSRNVEPGSLPPITVQLDPAHVGILMGAVEWSQPGSGLAPTRLDELLASSNGKAGRPQNRMELQKDEAGDIESLGIAFLESLRTVTSRIHHQVDLKPDEPLVELLIVDYGPNDYGPEVWRLSYRVKQTELRDDFWDTLALRPSFEQLYPPEKHGPRLIVESSYPAAGSAQPTLNDLLGQNDARLRPIRASDPKVAQAAQHVLDGSSNKAELKPAATFLEAALRATAAPDSKLSLASFTADDVFSWVLAPAERARSDAKRDADAPSLKRHW